MAGEISRSQGERADGRARGERDRPKLKENGWEGNDLLETKVIFGLKLRPDHQIRSQNCDRGSAICNQVWAGLNFQRLSMVCRKTRSLFKTEYILGR